MIEQIMFFALGLLSATLVALLVLPAVWHRAVRLTTRRVEAAVPVSIFEIQADKDQQRAAYALSQRRLELQLEQTRARIMRDAAAIEQLRLKAFDLDKRLTAKTADHDALTIAHAELTAAHADLTARFADTSMLLEQATTTLANTRAALATTSTALAEQTTLNEELRVTLVDREASLLHRDGRIRELERHLAEAQGAHAAVTARLTDTEALLFQARIEIKDLTDSAARIRTELTEELAGTKASLDATRVQNEERGAGLAVALARVQELEATLAGTDSELRATRETLDAQDARRQEEQDAAQAEIRRQADALAMLTADHAMMSDALERARAERSTPQADPAGAPAAGRERARAIASADAPETLKEAILDLAAKVAARAADTQGTPFAEHLARREDHAAGQTLAERIRTARALETQADEAVYPLARQAAGE
ncbi:hypothetical protein ACLBXM_02455 [Xanthobacteraceae bacterium A53D]